MWLRQYINKNDEIHTHNTRLKDSKLIHLYKPTTDFGKRSLKFRAAKYYDELPEDMKFELDDSEKYNKAVLNESPAVARGSRPY